MTTFTEVQPTLENYWRSIILVGLNSASFKFAFGKSLLELSQQGKEIVALDDLVFLRARILVLDRRAAFLVDHAERDPLGRLPGREQLDRNRDEPE